MKQDYLSQLLRKHDQGIRYVRMYKASLFDKARRRTSHSSAIACVIQIPYSKMRNVVRCIQGASQTHQAHRMPALPGRLLSCFLSHHEGLVLSCSAVMCSSTTRQAAYEGHHAPGMGVNVGRSIGRNDSSDKMEQMNPDQCLSISTAISRPTA